MLNIVRYETPVDDVKNLKGDVIFLAGPTVRGNQTHLQPSWRFNAIDIFRELNFDGTIILPEFSDIYESDKSRPELPLWEYEGLKRANVILFWVPRTRELIGLTTNWELGYWMGRDINKVVYGRPDDAYRIEYDDIMWTKLRVGQDAEIYTNLKETIEASINKLNT